MEIRKIILISVLTGAVYVVYKCPCAEFLSCSKKEVAGLLSAAFLLLLPP